MTKPKKTPQTWQEGLAEAIRELNKINKDKPKAKPLDPSIEQNRGLHPCMKYDPQTQTYYKDIK